MAKLKNPFHSDVFQVKDFSIFRQKLGLICLVSAANVARLS